MAARRAGGRVRITVIVMAAVLTTVAGLWVGSGAAPSSADGPFENPHGPYATVADSCAACHRSHTAESRDLLQAAAPQSTLCLSCHDGTGSNYNVAAEYSDAGVPDNDPATSSFYAHPAVGDTAHVSARTDEFYNVENRHSACTDCHNPHSESALSPFHTANGWTASGSIGGITGVSGTVAWQDPINYEYELCLKCHSRYTQLLSYTKESYKKTDKAAEFDPGSASYHPVEAAGKNATPQLQNSLNGGKLWRFTTSSTIRCTHCHGNYRLASSPPSLNQPPPEARLAPHASQNRGLLTANHRDRDLKPRNEAYRSGDFALCYLCHSEAPFSTSSDGVRSDTNFRLHGKHLAGIPDEGSGGLDIDTFGAGQGNAICAECHYRTHGTAAAPWTGNQTYSRGVNFAPDVQPLAGGQAPVWSLANRTCSLTCHGEGHNNEDY